MKDQWHKKLKSVGDDLSLKLNDIFYLNLTKMEIIHTFSSLPSVIAPDKDSRQLGIYPPLFGLIGYFKF